MKVWIRSLSGREIAEVTCVPLTRDKLYVVKIEGGIYIPLYESGMEAVEVE